MNVLQNPRCKSKFFNSYTIQWKYQHILHSMYFNLLYHCIAICYTKMIQNNIQYIYQSWNTCFYCDFLFVYNGDYYSGK